jgi:ferric-dicitrate binding protein FerR (iron transport regulator)
MQIDRKIQLLQKFYNGSITDSELKEIFYWLNSEKGSLEYERLWSEESLSGRFDLPVRINQSQLFSKLEEKMTAGKSGRKRFLPRLRNAAAIFILGLILPVAYYYFVLPHQNNQQVYIKELLSNEKVKKLKLPDGTVVCLMSGSAISYPSSFSGSKTRNVEVQGEAFFDVAKDTSHPFVLNMGEVSLEVVGTSFNVTNYGNEDNIQVALKSGKVNLFKGNQDKNNLLASLNPGQLMTFNKAKEEFRIKNVDVEKYTSWINGTLLFNNDPLSEVLKKLGRWYNIQIEIEDPAIYDFPFTATIKNENLEQIINLLRYSTPFKYSLSRDNGEPKLQIEKQ